MLFIALLLSMVGVLAHHETSAAQYIDPPMLIVDQPLDDQVWLTWEPVAGVDSYTLWRSQTPSFDKPEAVYSGAVDTVYQNLAVGTWYYRLQAGSAWSNTTTVVVHPLLPDPTLASSDKTDVDVCAAIPGQSYHTLSVNGARTDRPAEVHADLNLALRGYWPTTATYGLMNYNGASDSRSPQLPALFTDNRTPRIIGLYRVSNWNWSTNTRGGFITDWPVTLLGVGTGVGEIIRSPDSGYNIGDGYEALVLYATETRLTLKYTREDNVVRGYTVHLENVCTEPSLLSLYRSSNASGRSKLPALKGAQPLGRARSGQINVAVRDTGRFMDPRSRKDWWRGR